MQVICPSCTIGFNVPDNMIPSSGRKLRCSKCKHQWHFIPPSSQAAATSLESTSNKPKINFDDLVFKPENQTKLKPNRDFGDDINFGPSSEGLTITTKKSEPLTASKPIIAVKEEIFVEKFSYSSLVLPLVFALIFGFTTLIYSNHNNLRAENDFLNQVYSLIKIKNLKDLIFQEIYFDLGQREGKNVLNIQGKLRNIQDEKLPAPHLRIIIRNAANKIIDEQVVPYMAAEVIEPNQVLSIDYPMPIYVSPEQVKYIEIDLGSYLEFALNLR